MEYLLFILFVWAFITALGHASWLIIATVGRFLVGGGNPAQNTHQAHHAAIASTPPSEGRDPDKPLSPVEDIAAFERMIDALSATGTITAEAGHDLKDHARKFAGVAASPQPTQAARPVPVENAELDVDCKPSELDEPVALEEPPAQELPDEIQSTPALSSRSPPRPPATPQRAFSEIIASFLADHNIRWGELVAGLLIVVCSIGLVVSLWNTLTATHRVVPSLIFMSGDAAIFAAGLYTMRRWRLRHTSRAVLIIATLLVPLCVLAGLAAAGATVDSVSLFSPSTMAAIIIGTLGCGWLLWQASLALVGRGSAVPLTASVVAPTLCLPLLPTAARLLETNAGSFLFLPATASAIALLTPARRHFQIQSGRAAILKVGHRFWKNHWLRLGIAASAFASVVVYAAFLYRADGRVAWIQIAIATTPFWIAVMAVHAGYLKRIWKQKRWATPRFISTVLVVMAISCILAILPASIERVSWLWMHATAVSVSTVLAAWVLQGRFKLLAAGVPLGIAATLSSPYWLGGADWSDLPVWRTLLGGEPLMVAIAMTILSGAVSAIRWLQTRHPGGPDAAQKIHSTDLVLAFWATIASGQAISLSVAPPDWLGMLPIAGLAVILATLMVIAAVLSMRVSQLAWVSAVTGVSFWITCLSLVRWNDQGITIAYHSIAPAMLGMSISMLALAAACKVIWAVRRPANWTAASDSISRLAKVSAVAACGVVGTLAATAAVAIQVEWMVAPSWRTSTWLIAAATAVLAATAIFVGNRRYLQLAMVGSVAAAFCGLTSYQGVELWQQSSWNRANALWSLAGVFLVVGTGWFAVREAVNWKWSEASAIFATRLRMPDGWLLLASIGLLIVAIGWQYLAVLCGPLGSPLNHWFDLNLGSLTAAVLRFALIAGAACSMWLWIIRESRSMGTRIDEADLPTIDLSEPGTTNDASTGIIPATPTAWLSRVLGVLGAFGGLFVAILISCRLTDFPSLRLIGTTTLASGGIWVSWLVASCAGRLGKNTAERLRLDRTAGISAIAAIVIAGSLVLLWSNWWLPIIVGFTPDRWSTLAIAGWWLAASVGMLFGRATTTAADDVRSMLSATLLPMAVGISIPAIFQTFPVVWWQASVLGSVVWMMLAWVQCKWQPVDDSEGRAGQTEKGVALSRVWIAGVGLVSAAVTLWAVLRLQLSPGTVAWSLPLGAITSLLALAVCCWGRWSSITSIDGNGSKVRSMLPFLPVVMSGHIATLAETMGWVAASNTDLIVMTCVLIGCVGSAILVWWKSPPLHAWHVTVQTLVLAGFVFNEWWLAGLLIRPASGGSVWMALAGLATGAVALMRFVRLRETDARAPKSTPLDAVPRLLGWFIAIAGGWMILIHPDLSRASGLTSVTLWMAWIGGCVMLWRSDRLTARGDRRASRPDIGVSSLLIPMLAFSLFELANSDGLSSVHRLHATAVSLAQFAIVVIVGLSAWLRPHVVPRRPASMWTISMYLLVGGTAVAAMGVALMFDSAWQTCVTIAMMAASVSTTVLVGGLPWAERQRARLAEGVHRQDVAIAAVDRLSISIERAITGLVCIGSMVAIGFFAGSDDVNVVRASVLAVGVLAWSLFQLSEQTTPPGAASAERRRWLCLVTGLWTIALIAVLGQPHASQELLTATMRLLIAGVLTIGVLTLAVPRLLRGPFLDRWQLAFRRGSRLTAWVTAVALLSMLAMEMILREGGVGVPGLGKPLVVLVATLLGVLALMVGAIAILSGPGFTTASAECSGRANWLQMDDSHRRRLLYAAQGIAALAWLHVFLCRTGIAFLGLRQVWPYIVMGLAFASVGLTQWAVRRDDRVLADAMRKNAMFLPLIPVIGFWLSGAYATMFESQSWSWTFYRGTASYQGLLLVGAIYYGVLAVMWKRGFPRIATVVLANAALWVMLTQTPGWDFLAHPQAWLIPPAVCVLAVAHWQRDQLDPTLGSAIRYGATLVIYISSTADMLMSEIGSSLWGPVILILLSLAGMLIGVAFHIKPFLYLGTIFIFMGVTSMVWHAGQAFDAVWPWWVFGITTGLILLSVLAGIEKHRDKLQRWSDELAKWEN